MLGRCSHITCHSQLPHRNSQFPVIRNSPTVIPNSPVMPNSPTVIPAPPPSFPHPPPSFRRKPESMLALSITVAKSYAPGFPITPERRLQRHRNDETDAGLRVNHNFTTRPRLLGRSTSPEPGSPARPNYSQPPSGDASRHPTVPPWKTSYTDRLAGVVIATSRILPQHHSYGNPARWCRCPLPMLQNQWTSPVPAHRAQLP